MIKKSVKSHIQWLEKEIQKLENELAKIRACAPALDQHTELLASIPGVGILSASYCAAFLPELGHYSPKQLSALVGVAPFNQDSGKRTGKRRIQGGRGVVRRILYLASIVAIRCNPDMKAFYKKLKEKGKPSKVAIIAVVRKLLGLMNSIVIRQKPWQENLVQIS